MGFYVNGFFSKGWALQRSSPLIHRRKTAVNSLELLQSPPNSALVTHDSTPFHSLSCFKTPLYRERIKGRKSLQPFPSEAIDWTLAWTSRYRWKIATRPETQITHTRGGRQSLAPVDILMSGIKIPEKENNAHRLGQWTLMLDENHTDIWVIGFYLFYRLFWGHTSTHCH